MSVGHPESLFAPCAVATVNISDREDGAGAAVLRNRQLGSFKGPLPRSAPGRGLAGAMSLARADGRMALALTCRRIKHRHRPLARQGLQQVAGGQHGHGMTRFEGG